MAISLSSRRDFEPVYPVFHVGGPKRAILALFWAPGACLPIVDVPVHIVTGMPMTVGMGMRVAITMGTKKYIIGIALGYSHGHAHYILAVPMTLSMGTIAISGWMGLLT